MTSQDPVRSFVITSVLGRCLCGRHPRDDGWLLKLDDDSMFFCPNAACDVQPRVGEVVDLTYRGNSFRIIGIVIGNPPRNYRCVTPTPGEEACKSEE